MKCWVVPQGSHRFKKLQLLNRMICRISCWPSASRCSIRRHEAQQTSANACRRSFHRQKLIYDIGLSALSASSAFRLHLDCALSASCLSHLCLVCRGDHVCCPALLPCLLAFLAFSEVFCRSICLWFSQKSLGPPLDSYVIGIPWCNTRESACLQPFRSIRSIAIAEYDQCTWEHGMNSHTVDWENPPKPLYDMTQIPNKPKYPESHYRGSILGGFD